MSQSATPNTKGETVLENPGLASVNDEKMANPGKKAGNDAATRPAPGQFGMGGEVASQEKTLERAESNPPGAEKNTAH